MKTVDVNFRMSCLKKLKESIFNNIDDLVKAFKEVRGYN